MTLQDNVAAEIRAEMARKKISGRQAGNDLGWSQYYIAARLRGEISFSLIDLEKMADYLEVPVTKFFLASETSSQYIDLGAAA